MIHKLISFIKKEIRHVKYEKLLNVKLQLQDEIQSYENVYSVEPGDAIYEIIEEKKQFLSRVEFKLNQMRENQ